MATTMAGGGVPASAKTFLGHPRGLYMLFFAEMWERFSYYGMRAILVFYLTKHFLFGENPAYAVYGAYTSMVYITPVIGGYLADKYLGARKAVFAGGILIAIGHLLIALVEGPQGEQGVYLNGFYAGLAFIIVGTGFLKANISVLVGQLYRRDDVRRDGAFSIFYMGINLGAFIGPILIGYLGERVGWSWGFGAAGIGMLLGLVVFVLFRHDLHGAGAPADPVLLAARTPLGISREWLIYLGSIVVVGIAWLLIRDESTVGTLLLACFGVTFLYIFYRALFTLPRVERNRVFAALYLIALCPLFWALFEQAGSSLNVFTDQRVDRHFLGWEMPASWFQSVNSFWIITLAPLFGILWVWLGKRGLEPSAALKFALGLIQVGLGFIVLVLGAGRDGAMTPMLFVILLYLLHSTAELCFSPVGLSSMTRLSTGSMVGLMMGTWFLSTAAGNFLAAQIAQMTGGEGAGPDRVLEVYWSIGWYIIVIGVVAMPVSWLVSRLMHLDTIGQDETGHALAGESQLAEPAAAGTRTKDEQH
ncbi:peptide MFS transporter [Sphingomonas hengshuiensis]|uniref:MFS transporter n=1 Tax=Sphingomonas hengshuiensis TaxID=1609977 RepID=A0A7U4JBT3_9SPHN|nr:peptide MFS transporter [Sphingomonas hengshuiensis]AJP73837.1 MFS transporter [Sphingomonas hengshuiensis]